MKLIVQLFFLLVSSVSFGFIDCPEGSYKRLDCHLYERQRSVLLCQTDVSSAYLQVESGFRVAGLASKFRPRGSDEVEVVSGKAQEGSVTIRYLPVRSGYLIPRHVATVWLNGLELKASCRVDKTQHTFSSGQSDFPIAPRQ